MVHRQLVVTLRHVFGHWMPDVPEDSGGSPLDLAGDWGRVGDLIYPQERNGQEKEHRNHGVPGL